MQQYVIIGYIFDTETGADDFTIIGPFDSKIVAEQRCSELNGSRQDEYVPDWEVHPLTSKEFI